VPPHSEYRMALALLTSAPATAGREP